MNDDQILIGLKAARDAHNGILIYASFLRLQKWMAFGLTKLPNGLRKAWKT